MKANINKIVIAIIGATATPAFANTTGFFGEGSGLLTWLFVGFVALVVILQAIPAMFGLAKMIVRSLSSSAKEIDVTKA